MKYPDSISYCNQIELEADLKKYLGLSPYDGFTNPVAYDAYYLNSIYIKYGRENVTETLKKLFK